MKADFNRHLPILLTRGEASKFLGVDPKSCDKYIRSNDNLERFMIGRHERYTAESLIQFIKENSI